MNIRKNLRLLWPYTLGILGLRKSDILLVSFPKTGNTWIRFLLCNYLSLHELGGRTVDFHVLDAIMPALGKSNLLESWPYYSIPRFVKTHRPYHSVFLSRPARVVYILRDPRDVMVSYFHFLSNHLYNTIDDNFESFLQHPLYGLEAFFKHYTSWRPHIDVLIRYEALKADTNGEFQRLLKAAGRAVDIEKAQAAIRRSTFEQTRRHQEKRGLSGQSRFRPGYQFARKGQVGEWSHYFSHSNLEYYKQLCHKYDCHEYST